MVSLLELMRINHEKVEELEKLVAADLHLLHQNPISSSRVQRMQVSRRIRKRIDQISLISDQLVQWHQDADGCMEAENTAFRGGCLPNEEIDLQKVFIAFDHRLRDVGSGSRVAADNIDDCDDDDDDDERDNDQFSGEEAFGKFLDLHELYNIFINSSFGEPMAYTAYIDHLLLSPPSAAHLNKKKTNVLLTYSDYLSKLLAYLTNFVERTQPLHDLQRTLSQVTAAFDNLQGPEEYTTTTTSSSDAIQQETPTNSTAIDLELYSSAAQLMSIGRETLKQALSALGLKTGGTIEQQAERLFLTKRAPLGSLHKKHFTNPNTTTSSAAARDIAVKEAQVKALCHLLQDTIQRTKESALKKQALTYKELEAERLEHLEIQDGPDEDDEQQQRKIHNPLHLPMGWDGKPIPYWLYKLHGLGHQYICEICGNQTYWGRRSFEKHFIESRHKHGLRCLGITTNSCKSFNEVTSISEARQLWHAMQVCQATNNWSPDAEEFEDDDGNVYDRKIYRELKRQRLI